MRTFLGVLPLSLVLSALPMFGCGGDSGDDGINNATSTSSSLRSVTSSPSSEEWRCLPLSSTAR
jgi:hypothetical protein